MAFIKRVHFNTIGDDTLTFVIITIERSTRKQICGDTQLAMRGIPSDDPDYAVIAQKRMRRLISFRNRLMGKRGANWRQERQKLMDSFMRLKMHKRHVTCQKCHKKMAINTLSAQQLSLFEGLPWCPQCRNISIFDTGYFRREAELMITQIM
jgi:hypothetical protein